MDPVVHFEMPSDNRERIMKKTFLCSFWIIGLWSFLSTESPIMASASAPGGRPKPNRPPLAIAINDLLQHWIRSSEEEQPGGTVQIFRPAGSMEFPPSRFRMAYKFARNGGCEWYFLSPDDDHRFKPGNWRMDGSSNTLLQIPANGTTTAYRIVELSTKVLRLRPLKL
jgi:hypothetical protein